MTALLRSGAVQKRLHISRKQLQDLADKGLIEKVYLPGTTRPLYKESQVIELAKVYTQYEIKEA